MSALSVKSLSLRTAPVLALFAIAACGSRSALLGDAPANRDDSPAPMMPVAATASSPPDASPNSNPNPHSNPTPFDAGGSPPQASPDASTGSFDGDVPIVITDPDCDAPLVYLLTQSVQNPSAISFETFSPQTGSESILGAACPEISSGVTGAAEVPLAVDRSGALYVALRETNASGAFGPSIVRVDATTLDCEDTNFGSAGTAAPALDVIMGMAFLQNTTNTGESLYFIGNETQVGQPYFLAVTDATTLQWNLVGSTTAWGEFAVPLTGRTQLYAEAQANIDLVDTATAAVTVLWDSPTPYVQQEAPVALWAGDFYWFTKFMPGPVTRFRPQDGSSAQVATTTSTVLGAATSTCAP